VDEQVWRDRFAPHGLEIIDRKRTHSREVARFWDAGLRPFAVPLIRWVNGLDAETRLVVKRAFIETLRAPLTRLLSIPAGEDCPHVMYLLRKRG
jgi:hypothetical protein